MNALETRRKEDLLKVKALCSQSGGRVQFISADAEAPTLIKLRLNYKSASDQSYPESSLSSIELKIQIPNGYPLRSAPVATLTPVVFHPNVYGNGQVCLGNKWIVSEFLDLLVKRVIRIVTYQEDVLNVNSPANGTAVTWLQSRKQRYPNAFPTDTADTTPPTPKPSAVSWTNLK